jgi:serine/threonine-protein kinase
MSQPNTHAYAGRSHSLWYCDAQVESRYQWYETAFMDSPLMTRSASPQIDPYALAPGTNAGEALARVMGVRQVGYRFTPLVPGDQDEFIARWAEWFAMAAARTLQHPSQLPEHPPEGSYRR